MSSSGRDIIICIGDAHFPFADLLVISWIINQIIIPNKKRIKAIVQVGDLFDMFSYAKFPKRLIMTPREETWLARAMAEEFWDQINRACPESAKYQIKGNHDSRLMKRVVETMPELDHLIKYDELFQFDGVEVIHDDKIDLIIDGWHFIHGHTKHGKHIEAVHFNNVCVGHSHRGGTVHMRLHQRKNPQLLTELNCGFIADPHHEALVYRPLRKYFTWTQGVGVIDSHGGRFIPYKGDVK